MVVRRTNEAMAMMHDGDATPAQEGKSEGEGKGRIDGIPSRAAVNDDTHTATTSVKLNMFHEFVIFSRCVAQYVFASFVWFRCEVVLMWCETLIATFLGELFVCAGTSS